MKYKEMRAARIKKGKAAHRGSSEGRPTKIENMMMSAVRRRGRADGRLAGESNAGEGQRGSDEKLDG